MVLYVQNMSSPFEINIETAQLSNIPPIFVDLNLSCHVSGHFKYPKHLTTQVDVFTSSLQIGR